MRSHLNTVEFLFEESVVGYLEDGVPVLPGRHRYMPYRGMGHLRLKQALDASGAQTCYYLTENEKRCFTVVSIEERIVEVGA